MLKNFFPKLPNLNQRDLTVGKVEGLRKLQLLHSHCSAPIAMLLQRGQGFSSGVANFTLICPPHCSSCRRRVTRKLQNFLIRSVFEDQENVQPALGHLFDWSSMSLGAEGPSYRTPEYLMKYRTPRSKHVYFAIYNKTSPPEAVTDLAQPAPNPVREVEPASAPSLASWWNIGVAGEIFSFDRACACAPTWKPFSGSSVTESVAFRQEMEWAPTLWPYTYPCFMFIALELGSILISSGLVGNPALTALVRFAVRTRPVICIRLIQKTVGEIPASRPGGTDHPELAEPAGAEVYFAWRDLGIGPEQANFLRDLVFHRKGPAGLLEFANQLPGGPTLP